LEDGERERKRERRESHVAVKSPLVLVTRNLSPVSRQQEGFYRIPGIGIGVSEK
jgi:hypothetical protein